MRTPLFLVLAAMWSPSGLAGAELDLRRCPRAEACLMNSDALQFTLLPGDERAEAEVLGRHAYGADLRIQFRLFVPASTRLTNAHRSIVLAQLKAPNDHSPPVALRLKEEHDLVLTIRHHTRDGNDMQGNELWLNLGEIKKGRWLSFSLAVRTGESGRVEASVDGERIAHYEGPVGYLGLESYFKFGAYDFTRGLREPFVVFFREWAVEEK